ncbi:galactokinase [Virgibacillus sp. LDC1]|uniref:galactokinase n=2 Tax=Paenibacillus TaxID=44249 RepID=UPI002DBC2227|nr:galactokinase [Paenibacillus lautus]MCV4229602.1 galactokinase [Virgibacillus sp. LDC1]MEC0258565.1 galactokinase [Paenibacillus lautus]MEC0306041.1 galactokinase [Paenibacillus lautus]
MTTQQLMERFMDKHGESQHKVRIFNAPGRVNLIGEHLDYNGGYVLPAALEFGTTLIIRPRDDNKVSFSSTNIPYELTISLDEDYGYKSDQWTDYPVGVITELNKIGCTLSSGYDLLYHGDIPNGAGLSSSASIEVVTAYAFLKMEGKETDTVEIAKLSQRVENLFVGVNSGIMDQFAVANGKQDHAILLMCDTLEYELVPFRTGAYKIVISNTNKRRGLVDSKYNERRSECDRALEILQKELPALSYLAQLNPDQFVTLQDSIRDETVRRRAQHVVEENQRVHDSVEALKNGDLEAFGQYMNQSHDSLRYLYEVTGDELDALVEEAQRIPGTIGSRMTGAGFGGCTVSLVHEDAVERFIAEVGQQYEARTGLKPDFYVCGVGQGVHEVKEGE